MGKDIMVINHCQEAQNGFVSSQLQQGLLVFFMSVLRHWCVRATFLILFILNYFAPILLLKKINFIIEIYML